MQHRVGCKKDDNKPKELCEMAFIKGSKLAEALKHYYGWGTEVDVRKSFIMFKEMVDLDSTHEKIETKYAVHYLGKSYFLELGVKKDISKAVK